MLRSPTSAATDGVLYMQLFLIALGIPIMSLAVVLEQQRKTQHSLRESEARFRNMADTAPVMIWISGPDKLATFFNKGWLEFTGRRMEDELGYGWASGIPPDHRDECLTGYSSAFDERRSWRAECQLRRANGEYRWMLCNGAARFGPDGVFAGYVVSCSDITELKNVQEAALASQKLESLGVLAAGIAHDFNNLLGGIHASAEIVEAEGLAGSFAAEETKAIKATSRLWGRGGRGTHAATASKVRWGRLPSIRLSVRRKILRSAVSPHSRGPAPTTKGWMVSRSSSTRSLSMSVRTSRALA